MNLLDKLFQLVTRPEDVARVREMILQLAVQGRLVAQNPADEPATLLLEKIQAEKKRLVAEGKLKPEKELPPIAPEEEPYPLPAGWAWVRLGEITNNIHYGYTASADFTKMQYRLLRISDIQNNLVMWESVPGCEITDAEARKYLLADNDILIARTGGTVGKSYLVSNISVQAVFASYLIRLIPSKNLQAQYIKQYLESPCYWEQLIEKSQGTGQPNVNATSLSQLYFPLPPLAEQERIVAQVNHLLALCDQLENQLTTHQKQQHTLHQAAFYHLHHGRGWPFVRDHWPALVHQAQDVAGLRQTILQLAVQGRLVPQNPADEPAALLLERIQAEKKRLAAEGKLKPEKELPPISPEEEPYPLPSGWLWVRIATIFYSVGQKKPDKTFTYIDVGAINQKIGVISSPQILEAKDAPSRARKLVEQGCVIYSSVRPYLLNIAVIEELFDPEPIVSTAFIVMKPFKGINAKFLFYYLRSESFVEFVEQQMQGMAYPAISDAKFCEGYFPLPPLAEQERIVAQVNHLLALCDQLENQFTTFEDTRQTLLTSIIATTHTT